MEKINDYTKLEDFTEFINSVEERGKFLTRYKNEDDPYKIIEIYEYEMIYENYGMGRYDVIIFKQNNKPTGYTLKLKI